MIRRPPSSTRTYTLFPYTTLFRSRYSFAIVGSSQAFHGYQKRPAYEPHGICDRFPSSTPARHSPHPAGLSARRLPTLRAWPALASWMLCPQSRSAVAIGPIAASDTATALLLPQLRPYLLPVARLPRADRQSVVEGKRGAVRLDTG